MASDAVSVVERDHRSMEALFKRVLAGDGERTALVAEITARLTEHHEAEHLLRKARNLTASPHFDEAFTAFVAAVENHVEAPKLAEGGPRATSCTTWPRRRTSSGGPA